MRFGDVTDRESLKQVAFKNPIDVVISCLASRTGGKVKNVHFANSSDFAF